MKKTTTFKPRFRERALFVRLFKGDVFAVGGYVRDLVMGTPSEEVDILVVHHDLNAIIQKLTHHGRVDLVGKSFGIVKFTIDRTTYDIALPRQDVPRPGEATGRGHKDFLISADPELPLEEDLKRRDFRCNSMAIRLEDGLLIDPFGGLEDIRARRLRVTSPLSFPEDPLRVLRAARLASVLRFRVDPAIYELTQGIDLRGLSVERITEEIFKLLLLSVRPSVGLEELFKLGALRQLFPELYGLTLSIQDAIFHPEKDRYGHHTVWHHTKLTVDQAKALADSLNLSPERKLCLLLASLYHDTGKPSTARWEFKRGRMVITNNGHDLASERVTRRAFARLRIFSWNGYNLRKMVPLLIRTHHRLSELWQNRQAVTKRAFNRLAAETNGEIELLVYLDAADRAGRKERLVRALDRQATWLLQKFHELRVNRETIKPIIMGRDLIRLGVPPGPRMGKILGQLYELQLDGVFEKKADGLRVAREILKRKKR